MGGFFFFFSFGKARLICKAIDGGRIVCDGEITCGRRGDEVVDEGVKCVQYKYWILQKQRLSIEM